CLTVGLLTGFLLISMSRGSWQAGIPWEDPTIVTTIVVWLAMVAVLIRTMKAAQRPGRSVAMLSFLSGGFLLLTVLGPMLLAGAGSLNSIHGRPAESLRQQPAAGTSQVPVTEGSAP
ncbi:MAG: hypothetical protein ACK5YO_07575, partial [Planctomyces sp.]